MTTQEKIDLIYKVRNDFEGKMFDNNIVNQTLVSELTLSNTIHIELFNGDGNIVYEFPLEEYNSALEFFTNPFPKDGFCIHDPNRKYKSIAMYVSNFHNCDFSLDLKHSDKFKPVSITELKNEAKRIIDL